MLLDLINNQQLNVDKICLYFKDPSESNYQLLINGRGKVGINRLKNPEAFIDYSRKIDEVKEKS